MVKSILASLTGQPSDLTVLETAVQAARKFAAHVDCLHVTPNMPIGDVASAGALLGASIEELRARDRRASDARQRARTAFDELCRRDGLVLLDTPQDSAAPSVAFLEVVGSDYEVTIRAARAHDLTVIARDSRNVVTEPDRAGTIMLSSGRATLVPPRKAARSLGTRIVVAWKDTAEASRAVSSSMPFLTTADRVTLVSLSEGDVDLDRVTASARDVARQLLWHGVRAETNGLEFSLKPAAESILDEAYRLDADLIVMGGYGHSRLREFVVGGMTREILADCEIPVLLSH